jgi:hypothetical protein
MTVKGEVTVTDDKGQKHKIPVAGTIDLLGYDAAGNFYIFDMKTVHNLSTKKILERRDKWARQVSLYKDLLMQSYGINVSDENLKVIPISVKYDDPKGTKYGKVEYSKKEDSTVSQDDPRYYQLMADGVEFKGATPVLYKTTLDMQVPLPYTPLNIRWNKLTDAEKAVIENEIGGAKPTSVETEVIERKPFEDPLLGQLDRLKPIENGQPVSAPPRVATSSNYDYTQFTDKQKRSLRERGVRNIKDWNNLTSKEQKEYMDCI